MNRPTLVLLPGLLNDERLWQGQSAAFSDLVDSHVADLTAEDSIPDLAESVLSTAPTERFLLAGLSMGGYVALEIMRRAPERVAALALLDTSARPDSPESSENRRALMDLAERDFPAVVEKLLPLMFHREPGEGDRMMALFTAMAHQAGPEVFMRQQKAIMRREDSRLTLHRIECPTLVLCGRNDKVTPVEVHQEIAGGIHGAHLTVIEECGHLSPLEQPEGVSDTMHRWLRGVVAFHVGMEGTGGTGRDRNARTHPA